MESLRSLREAKGLLQKDVAAEIGVNRTTYVKYERGDSEPSFEILRKLADFFNVTIDYLLGRDSEQKNNPDAAGTGDDEIYSILSELTPENQEKLLELARMYRASQKRPEDN